MRSSEASALDTKALSADVATAISPAGLLSLALTAQTGGTTALDSYISAAGKIEAVGGLPSAIYPNANDMTALRLVKGGTALNSYVLQPDAQAAGAEKLAGCIFYPTPALPAGTAVVADPSQIVVGVRQDAEVKSSVDQRFSADSTMARVVCRVDVGVNDFRGVVKVTA
jgi:HK97 family phage major capsid protein